jgi:hypothetical protein
VNGYLAAGAAFVLVRAAIWYFGHDRTLRRRLAAIPLTPIGRVKPGLVRVRGRVRSIGDGVTAPGSGRRCVAYSVALYTVDGEGRSLKTRFHGGAPFEIEDETGCARVQAREHVRVLVGKDRLVSGDADGTLLYLLIKQNGIAETNWLGIARDFRYEEAVVIEGDEASVLGLASVDVDPTLAPAGPRHLPIGLTLGDGGAETPLSFGGSDWRADVLLGPEPSPSTGPRSRSNPR